MAGNFRLLIGTGQCCVRHILVDTDILVTLPAALAAPDRAPARFLCVDGIGLHGHRRAGRQAGRAGHGRRARRDVLVRRSLEPAGMHPGWSRLTEPRPVKFQPALEARHPLPSSYLLRHPCLRPQRCGHTIPVWQLPLLLDCGR